MLTFTSEERDNHLVLLAVDEEVLINGEPYSDWTVVHHMATTCAVMEFHLEAAAQRLKKRYDRFMRSQNTLPIRQSGRVTIGHVIDVQDTIAAQRPSIAHAIRRRGSV